MGKATKVLDKKMIQRKKRLDKEMKHKEFAAEQARNKEVLEKKQSKLDVEEAGARGKFDEAFHKQTAINKELLHKKGMEGAVKGSTIQRIHEKDRKARRILAIKLAKIKDRTMKRTLAKVKRRSPSRSLRFPRHDRVLWV